MWHHPKHRLLFELLAGLYHAIKKAVSCCLIIKPKKIMDYSKFRQLVYNMRFYQKTYFKTRSHHVLHTAKQLESQVDQELIALEKERLGVPKKPPVSDLFPDLK